MKRERSHSGSPIMPPKKVENFGFLHGGGEGEFRVQQQILFDLLRRTSLAEQKDREICEWLDDAYVWVKECKENKNFTVGALAELRFLVLGVLHTLPWWRVFESRETMRLGVYSRDGHRHDMWKITRWHDKIKFGFERVCLLLMEQSVHAVRGVMEVAMKPFCIRSPVADGAQRMVPADTIMRLMNAVATNYDGEVVQDVLRSCLRFLVPRWRWGEKRHHRICIALFLHLALEAHIPVASPCSGEGRTALSRSVNGGVRCKEEGKVCEYGSVGCPASSLDGSLCQSDESGADVENAFACQTSAHGRSQRQALSVKAPLCSSSDADLSDAGQSTYSCAGDLTNSSFCGRGSGGVRVTEFSVEKNQMLLYGNELIQFVLQWLLELELSLQAQEDAARKTSEQHKILSPGRGTDLNGSFVLPFFSKCEVRRSESVYLDILRTCTDLVFHRLAEVLIRHRKIPPCGSTEWWQTLLTFHFNSVLMVECPICLIYLAPSLALVGGTEEATDMFRKFIVLVTKGCQPGPPNIRCPLRSSGSARVRMAPPTTGRPLVPKSHRTRFALLVYPMFCFMREHISNVEDIRKQLCKCLMAELGKSRISNPSPTVSSTVSLSLLSPFAQVLFAQVAALSDLLELSVAEEMISQASGCRPLKVLLDAYLLQPGADANGAQSGATPSSAPTRTRTTTAGNSNSGGCGPNDDAGSKKKKRFNLAKMEENGILYPQLMNDCPWDWRSCQIRGQVKRV